MSILAYYEPRNFTVEVTSILTTTRKRKVAAISTIDGSEPFPVWTNGGWAYTSHTTCSLDMLSNIREVASTVVDEPDLDEDPLAEFFQNEPDYGDEDDIDPRSDLYAVQ